MIRAVKYLIALCVIYAAIIWLMSSTGNMLLSPRESLMVILSSTRGVLMIVAIVILSALYPLFGFITRNVNGSTTKHRDLVINAFSMSGFSLIAELDGAMEFWTDNFLHRLTLLFENMILFK